jgi:hypothetical protein
MLIFDLESDGLLPELTRIHRSQRQSIKNPATKASRSLCPTSDSRTQELTLSGVLESTLTCKLYFMTCRTTLIVRSRVGTC